MKKALKIIALAGALALCLLLTGCYQPPDEVKNGGPTGGVTAALFDTMAPTATVTVSPDTVVIETQNVFGPNYGQQTPTPTPPQSGGNGWDNWGSANTPTPSPGPGEVIVFSTPVPGDGTTAGAPGTIEVVTEQPATPTPTQAPVTPTPTPKSLQRGFTGSEAVRAVQKRLKELGYYKGSADGDFGPATEQAVKDFQKANGLTADGKVGEKTLAKMNAKNAVSYKEAHATATPKTTAKTTAKPTSGKVTATPNLEKEYYLNIGSKGSKVETLQRRLIELGWLDGKVTGTYDEQTAAAVSAFQKKTKGLWEDGVAGPDTLKALYSSNAARSSKPAASTSTTKPETLELGSEGAEVKKLQQKLKDLGYLSGSVDGKFGAATEAAVIAFQKNNNLTADGKAGSATQNKLYSGTAKKSTGTQVKIDSSDDNNRSGRDTSDISSTGYITLERDSKGDQVRALQKRLKELGFYNGSVDGSYGESTEVAVMAFQLLNNLTVDGKAGPATQRALYGSKSEITYSSLRQGDESSAVKNLQYTLYELGYYDGAIDGKYGQTTADAVRAFQIQNKITPVDGVAGSKTLSKMYSSDAMAATAAKVNYETVSKGMTGEIVVEIQDCLVQYGFLNEVTGVYDDATVDAVKAFQSANGLTPDGKCGERTLLILFGY
ncbi:MAG: peptidoglycan-binding protein [Clostridiales bacterium]|nr:peptidoglycan-binding protein [Clostridiales bacterium]